MDHTTHVARKFGQVDWAPVKGDLQQINDPHIGTHNRLDTNKNTDFYVSSPKILLQSVGGEGTPSIFLMSSQPCLWTSDGMCSEIS